MVELGEEFYQRTAQILEELLSGDDVDDSPLELDDKWFEHLREEDERLHRCHEKVLAFVWCTTYPLLDCDVIRSLHLCCSGHLYL